MTRSTKVRLITAVTLVLGMLAPLLGPAVTPASAVADVQTDRIGGADRFETAANVARAGHPGASTALIANGLNFPDALSGSVLAGALNAPILLVAPRSIPSATSSALSDLGVNDIVILGGPNAVSTDVENQLRQNYGVTRVFGADRYKTAVEIARRAAVSGVGTVDGRRTAFVSTGLNFPDALGAGPLAYEGNLPSFLTRTNELPPEVAQAIRDLNIEHVVILGGTQAVSGNVEAQIEAIGVTTERLNGRNRAETATFVADFAVGRMGFEGQNVLLARGDNFPDALAGGPLGGERRAVILLTATPCQLAIETRDWLEEHFGTVSRITALGGQSAVCDAVLREAEQAAETNNLPPDRAELTISGGSMNGGPKWQYQESDASPSKSLTLSVFVSSDPSEGSDPEAQRAPAAREDVVFNIRPSEGDEGNAELNLTARTGTNGIATVTYTRGNPGTDIITVRLVDDTSITDDGVGRWNTATMPLSLAPDTAQTLDVNQPREFTACEPGPEGSGDVPETGTFQFHLTTLELIDDDPNNDTNVPALRFSDNVTDDRGDTDETIGKVSSAVGSDGCVTFTVTSNAAQIFTLMAFQDNIIEPAANDDNTNPPEYRDIAGVTTFGGAGIGLNMTPANDNDSGTTITRRNGQQIVYTVTVVDAQGQPYTGPVDVSFEQLTDGSGATTTTAEFDWYDNSAAPSTQEGSENQTPPGATPTAAGTTRIEVVPNSDGKFTFAIVHPSTRINPTTGNPIAWIDLTGGTNNRPDANEPQARGENFAFNTGSFVTATFESLGCPPGTDQRGYPGGNNPHTEPDPCLGIDQSEDPNDESTIHWPLEVAAESVSANAGTGEPDPTPVIGASTDPSRGDIVFRFTLRDSAGRPVKDDPFTSGDQQRDITFRVEGSGSGGLSVAPHRPNPNSNFALRTLQEGDVFVVSMRTREGVAEIVVDRTVNDRRENNTSGAEFNAVTVDVLVDQSGLDVSCQTEGTPVPSDPSIACRDTAQWAAIRTDTTAPAGQHDGTANSYTAPITEVAPPTSCPSPTQPCFNGSLTAIDKARDYYVMNRGATLGGQAYVVYAVGGGGKPYTTTVAGTTPAPRDPDAPVSGAGQIHGGERPSGVDEYIINGLVAQADAKDNERCGYFSSVVQSGCARFDAALSFDDRMVYEFSGTGPTRTQTHWLTTADSPTP